MSRIDEKSSILMATPNACWRGQSRQSRQSRQRRDSGGVPNRKTRPGHAPTPLESHRRPVPDAQAVPNRKKRLRAENDEAHRTHRGTPAMRTSAHRTHARPAQRRTVERSQDSRDDAPHDAQSDDGSHARQTKRSTIDAATCDDAPRGSRAVRAALRSAARLRAALKRCRST